MKIAGFESDYDEDDEHEHEKRLGCVQIPRQNREPDLDCRIQV